MTTMLWALIAIQTAMAAVDTIYHHELTERLAWRPSQRHELALHAARNFVYVALFLVLGFLEPHGVFAMLVMLALAIEETNQTFRNSGLGNVKLRLVHSQAIEYDGTVADQFVHLYAMVDGLGPFKDVKRLRNEKRADIVGLIIDNPDGCGLSTRIGPESDEAYFVVHHACAATTMAYCSSVALRISMIARHSAEVFLPT